MPEKRIPFKKVSPKYQPKGLSILYEDQHIIVVDKMAGLLTMATNKEKERTAYFILTDYVKKGNERSKKRLFIVHRIDRDTSGVLIFAKNERSKNYLQENWKDFDKSYYALALGTLEKKEGEISSYLTENAAMRVYSISNSAMGKYAKTAYKVLRESKKFSLLEVKLFTGRKNQIRVHLAELGHPLAGDKLYGIKDNSVKRLGLHSASLKIKHPLTQEEMLFKTDIPKYFNILLKSN